MGQKDSWPLIESHFASHLFIQEQIDSSNKFFLETIQRIIDNLSPVEIRDKSRKCIKTYRYGKCMMKPMKLPGFTDAKKSEKVTPQLCRDRDLSYVCTLYVNSHCFVRYDDGRSEELSVEEVEIGDIPIMVGGVHCVLNGLDEDGLIENGECPYDQGGYFILSGKERAIVAQERLSYNQLFVFGDKSGLKAEIRCHCEDTDQQSTIHLKYALSKKQGPGIKVVIPHVHETKGVLLFAVFLALGIKDRRSIIDMILYPNEDDVEMREKLDGSITESESINNRESALSYLSQYVKPRNNTTSTSNVMSNPSTKRAYMRAWLIYILDRELFPHLQPQRQGFMQNMAAFQANVYSTQFQEYTTGSEYNTRCMEKAWFLAYSVSRLIRVALKRDLPSDRDHMAHKRLNLSGPLLAQLFKKKMTTQHNTMVKLLMKNVNNNKDVTIAGVMKQVDVTKGLAFSLKTGNWTGTKTNPTNSSKNQGVSQVLNRMNFTSAISHLRRTSASDTNLSVVRQLHNTQYGSCCLTGDAQIRLASHKLLSIKEIVERGYGNVMTVNPKTLEDEPSRIFNPFSVMADKLLKITCDDGKDVRCTFDHPFLVKKCLDNYEWVKAGDLTENDMLVTVPDIEVVETDNVLYSLDSNRINGLITSRVLVNGKILSKIERIDQLPGEMVYDFTTLSENHSFISNGFVTHNCPSETPEGHSCLTLGTLIEVPDGQRRIGDLKNGDVVITVDPSTYVRSATKIHSYFRIKKETFRIMLEGGLTVNATGDHPFLTGEGWKMVRDVNMFTDKFYVMNSKNQRFGKRGSFVSIHSIKRFGVKMVADFTTVSENHSFIANGIVTHNCGLVKNLALLCHITTGSKTHLVYKWLNENVNYIRVSDLSVDHGQGIVYGWKMFVNGKWLGISPEANTDERSFDDDGRPNPVPEWVHDFREARSCGAKIDSQVSISTYSSDRKEIYIFTDEGRFCRPLLVVHRKTGRLLLESYMVKKVKQYLNPSSPPGEGWSWQELIEKHVIEYIDVAESESPKIATYYSDVNGKVDKEFKKQMQLALSQAPQILPFTHCEIHPSMMLGVLASLISFPDHSQAPRNTYQSAMGKQGIGIPTLNYLRRYDTTNHILYYPQKPLVCTKMHDIIGTNKMPAGQTTIVAVMEYTGYNQEDSVILNQGWVDRGGGRSTLYKTYKAETKKHKILPDDKFESPDREETMGMKKGDYGKLGEDGIADIGARVVKGDIIVGITGPSPTFSSFSRSRSYNKANTQRVATNINPKMTKKDRSICNRLPAIMDSVMMTENAEQTTMVKVRTRTIRIPKIGDKFAASTGQKGTVGLILKSKDMPYTERDGIIPDILMNPHAFPSRMTINQQIEMLLGKQCANEMMQGDSTPFRDRSEDGYEGNIVDEIARKLLDYGYEAKGEEEMIDGATGRKLKAKIFIGPAYYQRLKHMVDDKKHSRSTGPQNQLTRQPVEGRMRDGGLRVGEMEKDTLVAHGAAKNLLELMMKKSDEFIVPYCELCGMIAEAKENRNVYYCRQCDNMDHVYMVVCPYAKKLLFQELMGMLVQTKVELGDDYE